jgi:hypothetical protein
LEDAVVVQVADGGVVGVVGVAGAVDGAAGRLLDGDVVVAGAELDGVGGEFLLHAVDHRAPGAPSAEVGPAATVAAAAAASVPVPLCGGHDSSSNRDDV